MQIHEANVADADIISQLVSDAVREFVAPTLSAAGTAQLLSTMDTASIESYFGGEYRFFIAYSNETPIGVTAINLPTHLFYLFVRADYQRRGVGRMLWDHARKQIDANSITVNSSLNAVEAYKAFGFEIAGPEVERKKVRFQPMRWTREGEATTSM